MNLGDAVKIERAYSGCLGTEVDEGRGKLRKARGRSKHPLIPGFPNRATASVINGEIQSEYIGLNKETRGIDPS